MASRYKEIVESLMDMIYELDSEGRFVYSNNALEKYSGYSKKELQGIHYWELVRADYKDILRKYYANQRKKRVPNTYYEFPMISKSGEEIWVGQNVSMLFDDQSDAVTVRAVARDVTTLRGLRIELEEKNALTELILNTMDESVVVADQNGKFLIQNKASKNIMGANIVNLHRQEWSKHLHSYYTDKVTLIPEEKRPLVRALKGHEVQDLESYIKNTNSDKGLYVKFNSRPLKNKQGEIIGALVVTSNIDTQKEIEIHLRESEERFRAISDSSPLGIFVTDESGKCIYTNKAYQRISGLSFDEALGTGWVAAIHKDDTDSVFRQWEKAVKKASVFKSDFRFKRKGGAVIWAKVRASAMMVNGQNIGYVGSVEDITEEKEYAEALEGAKRKAEDAAVAKDEFLSTMSHEIRTPLNAIIGMAHLLKNENPGKHQLENLKTLEFSSENLLSLINDILDFGKIESNKIALEKIPFDFYELLNNIQNVFSIRADEKGILLNVIIDTSVPKSLLGDPTRLTQILSNLISNAIKFTSQGRVKLQILVESETTEKITLTFTVSDTGIGIPKARRKAIFERFTQAEKETTRKYGGSGLGLAITKKLVELHGNTISVDSTVGKGSAFTFNLDFIKNKSPQKEIPQKDRLSGNLSEVSILVVEDNQVNQMVVRKFLQAWQAIVDEAGGGIEAIEKCKKNQYDIILMDIQMPEMDGYQATEKIRALKNNKNVPILALTADSNMDIKTAAMNAGMDDLLTKPINSTALKDKIISLLHLKSGHTIAGLGESYPVYDRHQFINLSRIESIADGDQDFFVSILESFGNELAVLKDRYKEIILKADKAGYDRLMHKYRPALEMFQAELLKEEILKGEVLLEKANSQQHVNSLKNVERLCEAIIDLVTAKIKEVKKSHK